MHLSVGVHLNSGGKSVPFLVKTFFWSSPEFAEKGVTFLVRTFFLGLHLFCSPEQNRGRGSSPPMLKIGVKLQISPPMLKRDRHPLIAKQMGPPTRYTLRRITARTKDRI